MKNIYIKVFYLLIISLASNLGIAQNFNTSNYIAGSGNIRINGTTKLPDGYVLFGDFLGTISRPENILPDGRDIILAKYDDNFDLSWVKHIGGTLIDLAKDIAVDSENNLYILGSFQGTCLFDGLGGLTSDGGGAGYDVFLAKYSSSGNFLWSKKIAYNSDSQYGTSVDVDGANLIVGGYYTGSIDFDNQSFTSAYGMYYAKLDTSGTFIWAKDITTSSSSSTLESVSVFSDGYYFNGQLKGTATFDSLSVPKVYTSNNGSFTDAFLCKTDSAGTFQWLRRTYGDGNAFTGTMAQDTYENIYYTGLFNGTNMTVDSTYSRKGSKTLINKGSSDIFILKYNKNGNLNWNSAYGRDGTDWARDIKWKNDALYVTGYFSDTIAFGNDTLVSSSLTDQDAFIGIFDNYGNKLRASKIDDSNDGNESGMTISIDTDNSIYWGGTFKSTTVIVGDNTFTNPNIGKQCVYFTKGSTPLSVAITSTKNSTCNLSNDGELVVTPYFGVYPFTYEWSHDVGLNDSTATGLSPGKYWVTVTGAMGSSDSTYYTLTEPKAFVFKPTITDVTVCSYNTNAAIDLNMTGGNGGNSYLWIGNGTSNVEDQTNLATGTYAVTVTDSKSCTGDTSIVITGPDPVYFKGSSVTHYTGPADNGAIDITVQGGTGDPSLYTAVWSGPAGYTQTGQNIADAAAGIFDVTVTDDNACDFDTIFTIQNQAVFSTYIVSQKKSCNGGFNGEATVGFYSPDLHTNISYLWDVNAGSKVTATATGLAAGTYSVTVTDNDAIPAIDSVRTVTIGELAYVLTADTLSTSDVDCKGGNDGSIDLSITVAGVLPYTYLWDGPSSYTASTQDVSGLYAGTYSATVSDANGCEFQTLGYVIEEPALNLTATASIESEPLCNGSFNGEVRVDATGGNTGDYSYQWNDPGSQATQIAYGLDARTYTVTVTDSKGCQASDGIVLTQPTALSVSKTIGDLTCFNVNTGTIDITAAGGTVSTVYSYNWSTADGSGLVGTSEDQTGLGAGTYALTVTDDNSCVKTDSYIVTEPAEIVITDTTNVEVTGCYGNNNGTILITATGGTGSLSYTLSPGGIVNTNGLFTGLTSGYYTIDVSDASGCGPVTSAPIQISEPTIISIDTESKTDVTGCNGDNTGTITITASGGTGSLTYNLLTSTTSGGTFTNATATDGDSDGSYTGLGAGFYKVEITDANGCGPINSTEVEVTEPSAITISSAAAATAVSCNGSTDGTVSITGTGGTGSLTYNLLTSTTSGGTFTNATVTDGDSDGSYTGLGSGFYKVEITDANGCGPINSTEVEVTEPSAITISSAAAATAVSCNGSTDGTVSITGTGGTGSLTYNLLTSTTSGGTFTNATATDGDSDGSYTGLGAGFYKVEITDANGCGPINSTEVEVTEPSAITISSAAAATAVSCNGSTDGTVSITGTGGTGSLTYNLLTSTTSGGTFTNATATDGDSDGSYTGLGSGFYKVEITDANGCGPINSTEVEVTEPSAITISSAAAATAVSCNGSTDGTVSITGTGGTGSLTYNLLTSTTSGGTFTNATATDGDSDGSYTGLGAGFYKVEITDANGCGPINSTEVEVTEPSAITISSAAAATAVSCNGSTDGTVSITGTGGTGSLTYNLLTSTTSGGTFTNATATDGDSDGSYIGLGAGFYKVEITDANGCGPINSTEVEVTEPSAITISSAAAATAVSCNGSTDGTVSITGTGGTGSLTYNLLTSTTSGGTFTNATVTDGDSDGSYTGLGAGFYKVEITDANGCGPINSTEVEVTEPSAITISSAAAATAVSCNGSTDGTVSITGTGGTGSLTYNLLTSTTSGGTFTNATVTDGDSDGSYTGLGSGFYKVEITDANGCGPIISTEVEVTEPAVISIAETSVLDVSCNGLTDGSIDITVSGGTAATAYTYVWSTTDGSGLVLDSEDQTDLGAGTYDLTITDDNSCEAITSITILEPSPILIEETLITDVSCDGSVGGSIDITVTGGTAATVYTYNWTTSDGSGLVTDSEDQSDLGVGTYDLTVTDDNACQATTSIIISSQSTILIEETLVSDVSCDGLTGGSIDITVSGGTVSGAYVYNWTTVNGSGLVTDSEDQTDLGVGTYDLTVTDDNGCVAYASISISSQSTIVIDETLVTDVSCDGLTGGSIDITVSGGTVSGAYTYNWTTVDGSGLVSDSEDQSDLGVGTYDLTVTDDDGCVAYASISISSQSTIVIDETLVTDVSCDGLTGGSIDITVSGGTVSGAYTYNWTTVDGTGLVSDSEDQSDLGVGTYDLTVTDDNGCVATTSITISTQSTILIEETSVLDISCNGLTDGSIDITVSGGTVATAYTYNWSTADGSGEVATDEDQTGLGAGTYNLTVTDDNSCTSTASIIIVEPLAITIASESFVNTTQCSLSDGSITIIASGGTGNLSYTLNPDNIINSTGEFTALDTGDYTVDVIDDNNCMISSSALRIDCPDAIIDISKSDKIKLYPNPTSDKIFIEMDFEYDNLRIEVISISGQTLYNKDVVFNGTTNEEINLSSYPQGIYFIRVYNDKYNFEGKILLQ